MTNNLRKVAQDLRTFAKRTKDFKFTNSALITFILTRMTFAASSPDTNIQSQAKQLNTSISQSRADLKKARKETDKLINNANLELIQLMEQGEHVTKPAWGTWQFGTGYTYNNWMGRYNGRGNKNRDNENRVFTRALGRNRFIQSTAGGKYGATDLELTDTAEPSIEIAISAAIKPKSVNKQAPLINLPAIATPTLPALNVSMPSPVVVTPNAPTGPNLNITIVNPDASPFSDFGWNWLGGIHAKMNADSSSVGSYALVENTDISGGTFWSGVKPDGSGTLIDEAGFSGAAQDITHWNATNLVPDKTYDRRHTTIINSYNGRWTGNPGNRITGGHFYVAGGNGRPSLPDGTAAFHLVSDVHLQDVEVNLYGRAAFINAESWRGG